MSKRSRIGCLHPRIAATFALIPVTAGLEIGAMILADSPSRVLSDPFVWALAVAVPVMVLYFGNLVIWRPTIDWTPRRRWLVGLTTLAFLLILAGISVFGIVDYDVAGFACVIVALIGSGVALVIVAAICYDPPAGPAVPCPSCGYDLRGQYECRCPECGGEFTVGDLVAREANEVS